MSPNLEDRIWDVIEAVTTLCDAPPSNPHHASALEDVFDRCYELLLATEAEGAGSTAATPAAPAVPPPLPSLSERIARLIAEGRGIRETARILGVNPSTVSRSLRRTMS